MQYLVTGGAGFIGSNVTDELLRRGHSVRVFDDLSAGKEENLAEVREQIDFIRASICDLAAVQKACRGMDRVVHLAARTSVPRSVEEPLETNRVNVEGTLNVLLAARDAGVRRIVYAASSAAYGETPTLPKTETMEAAPISPYGVTKFVGELYAKVFGKVYGLENVSLRFFNVFGPRQDPGSPYSGVLSKFILAVLSGETPVVYGDGRQSRDFTYVDNIVDLVLRACDVPAASGMVLNGGAGRRVTLNQVLKELEKLAGRPVAAQYVPPRPGDILHSEADLTLSGHVLGYRPAVSFEEGLRRTWEWYKRACGKR